MNRVLLLLASLLLATSATAGDDVILIGKSTYVGGDIDITEPVEGSVRAAGGDIRLSAPVGGNAHLAGGQVKVTGAVKGKLRIAGGHVTLDGPVGGDVAVAAGKLEVGPNARIEGQLKFRGGELERDPTALVKGGIDESTGRTHGRFRYEHEPFGRSIASWVWTLGLMVLAAIIAGALPGPMRRMSDELVAHPWHAPLLGFIAITCIPVAAVLIMVTIIGIPLGILALLGYAALLLIGYVCVSVVVGGLLLERLKADAAGQTAWRVGVAALTVLVLSLLARIPFFGGFLAFIALLVGVGLIVAVVMRRTPKEAPPAAA